MYISFPHLIALSCLCSTPQNVFKFSEGRGQYLLIASFSLRAVLASALEHKRGCFLGNKKGIAQFFDCTTDKLGANGEATSRLLKAVMDGDHDSMMLQWSGIPENIPSKTGQVEKYVEAILSPLRGLFFCHHDFCFVLPSVLSFIVLCD